MELKMTSPYRRGADYGLAMGLYMSILFWCMSDTLRFIGDNAEAVGMESLIGWCLVFLMPMFLYTLLRRSYVKDGGMSTFSRLWLEGIMTYVFGGLIAIAVGYVYMHFVHPTFLPDLYNAIIEMTGKSAAELGGEAGEQYNEISRTLVAMRDAGQLPSAPVLLFNSIWYITFSGSLLSLCIAALARIGKVKSVN